MPRPPGPWSRPWELEAQAFAIADSLYYVGNKDVSCHLINTPDGAVLLDTAFAQTSYLLVDSIRSIGLQPDDIKLIIHTHGHVDHCGATRRFVELTGATTALGAQDIPTVEQGTALTCAEYLYGIPRFETFSVDRALHHGDKIEFGGVTILCHHTPGHTAGTITYTFDIEVEGQTRTAGLFGEPGLWTMLDEHIADQGYEGSREDFARSLEYLGNLDVDIWLGAHPGQCDTFEKQERLENGETPNPFVDPDGWKQFISSIQSTFKKRFA